MGKGLNKKKKKEGSMGKNHEQNKSKGITEAAPSDLSPASGLSQKDAIMELAKNLRTASKESNFLADMLMGLEGFDPVKFVGAFTKMRLIFEDLPKYGEVVQTFIGDKLEELVKKMEAMERQNSNGPFTRVEIKKPHLN